MSYVDLTSEQRNGMRTALVPGGRPTPGYDAARFRPAPDQCASYAGSADEVLTRPVIDPS
ncbi:hypothetical protein ACIBJE_26895 [Micromonospora sp. NPDC050187]|uniref:hypothetical protein n=1 Tax=Micromonospora sp. NPDC050187 TaxID=3364277 RepID=UPI0037987ACE